MNERAPKPEPLPDESEDSQKRNEEALEGLAQHMQKTINDKSVEGTPQLKLFSLAEKSVEDNFSDRKESFTDYLEWLKNDKDTPSEELAREAAERWYETVKGEFFLDDSHAVGYTKKGETIDLHVQKARELSTGEKVRSIKQALIELASRLQTKKELSDAKEIKATSWIVKEKPRLMEKLGFTVDDPISVDKKSNDLEGHDKGVGTARISVEDFLEKYKKDK
jgi:hypothetical protein